MPIARLLFYDVCDAPIAGTDEDHRVVILDKELIALRLWHLLHDLERQWVQFDVLRYDVADGVGRRPLPRQTRIRQQILPNDVFVLGRQCYARQWRKLVPERRRRLGLSDYGE